MKIYPIYILALCLLLTSCKKGFLDRQPLSSISPDAFFKTESDLNLYTNSFYSTFPSAEGIYNESADNVVKSDLGELITGKRTVPISGGGWSWSELRNINYFLENYDRVMSPAAGKKYAATARFFRAYFYFDKVSRFGDVPWYSGTININDEGALSMPRSPRALVMDSVLADIDFAIANMDAGKNVEKVTKWTALALKSRICLSEGTFRKYHPEFNLPNADLFLKAAASAANTLMTTGPYSIYKSSPEKAYLELFSSKSSIDQEVILGRRFSAGLQVFHNLNYYTITASYGRPGLNKSLVNTYLMKNGSRFTDLPGYEKMEYFEEVQNRDPRLSQTIRTPGYTRIGNTKVLVPEFSASTTGYQLIKFVTSEAGDSFNRSENDMPIFRMAEVLLNYAEAKAELGEATQADLDKSIKLLRDRVGMPNLDLAYSNANPDPYLADQYQHVNAANKGLILEIRRERRIELVMESYRWADLIRWKEGRLNAQPYKGMYFPGPGKYDLDKDGKTDIEIYTGTKPTGTGIQFLKLGSEIILENNTSGGNVLINPNTPKTFREDRDYLFPLPINELLLNKNLVQNPNWEGRN
ncbi:RagB/SusD family nutrient uptake outer membrane protein [Pedobacter sp. PLR]|uniref:RagB/SusD family nutrient uptake outer membrane protein n=1 Tax=Pedobacter sp. PLR TaxID=2994465 RepID=UPI0022465F76|nr:RagB/SusD family nutrient uptake outer membrane protein [Pedobacter sp. PLR]MCX2453341.1 RagB/SusD family nutrient uptake outer membrane protein [Pedobacter sp. PLR]